MSDVPSAKEAREQSQAAFRSIAEAAKRRRERTLERLEKSWRNDLMQAITGGHGYLKLLSNPAQDQLEALNTFLDALVPLGYRGATRTQYGEGVSYYVVWGDAPPESKPYP